MCVRVPAIREKESVCEHGNSKNVRVCVCEYVRKSESANLAQVTKIHLRDLGCKVNETLGLER